MELLASHMVIRLRAYALNSTLDLTARHVKIYKIILSNIDIIYW